MSLSSSLVQRQDADHLNQTRGQDLALSDLEVQFCLQRDHDSHEGWIPAPILNQILRTGAEFGNKNALKTPYL